MHPSDPHAIVIEALNECFNPKAEEHSSLATQLYFAGRQGSIVTELRRYAHHLIQGRMGTGKTMVLKFLSASCQLHGPNPTPELKHLGIYIGLSPAWLHSLQLGDDQARSHLFDSWFCLFAIECVLRELRDLPALFGPSLRTRETYLSLGKLLNLNEIEDEAPLLDFLETERERIERFFGSPAADEETTRDLLVSNAGRRIRPFFDRLARTLLAVFDSVLSPGARVFYLLDQFEQCSPRQQEAISKLLATAGSQASFFAKIGCRPYKPLALTRIAPQDYRVVQLEMAPDSPEYSRFAREVISLRIKAISNQLQLMKVPEPYTSLFSGVEALLGVHSFAGQWSSFFRKLHHSQSFQPVQANDEVSAFRALTLNKLPKRFAGLPTIRRLSGGFVRNLLSFVYQSFRLSLEENEHRTLRKRHLPPDAQDKACRAEAQNELGVRLRAILSSSAGDFSAAPISETRKEQVEALLRRLVRMFHKELISEKKEPALLTFQLPFNPTDPEYSDLFEILLFLRDLGYLSGDFSVDQPVLTLSPIVGPWLEVDQIEIPPIPLGVLRLGPREALQLAKPFLKTPTIRHTMRVFYASGWRTELELRLLEFFSEKNVESAKFLQELSLSFMLGSDPTGGNHVIFEQLHQLISQSNFLLAEVSSLNENVAFEIGLARALRKRTYHLVNMDVFKPAVRAERSTRFDNFIMGHHYFKYEVLPKAQPDQKSLEVALGEIVQHHSARLQRKRQQKFTLRESGKYNVIPYFHFENSSPGATWYGDLLRFARSLRREPLNPGPANRRRSQFDHYADAIDRSTHVVVDISKRDPFACLLYGYAIGTDRQVLPIWEAGASGPITDIRGLPDGGSYISREHLFEGIIKPWLAGEDV